MSAQAPTYSFKDTTGSLTNPVLGSSPIVFAGEIGAGEFVIVMDTERTAHETSADSTVMPSYVAGDAGRITIRMLQTSFLHGALLTLYNILKSEADAGNSSNWAASQLSLRNIVTQLQHICSGLSFSKIPDYPYAAQGQYVTWTLMACNIVNL